MGTSIVSHSAVLEVLPVMMAMHVHKEIQHHAIVVLTTARAFPCVLVWLS